MQNKKFLSTQTVILALAILLLPFLHFPAHAATPMPRFALPSVTDGVTIDSSAYQGKAILVNFFATWCPPCRKEIPSFIELQKEFGPKGFTVIGISTDEGGSALVAKFVEKMAINYPVVMGDTKTPMSFGGIIGIPSSFLVNKQGLIVKRYDGYVDHQTLTNDLNSIMR
ncbi:TlpA disulfide reductase family protein [Thiovibrio sp. JS02]